MAHSIEEWPCPWCPKKFQTVGRLSDHTTMQHLEKLRGLPDDHWLKPPVNRIVELEQELVRTDAMLADVKKRLASVEAMVCPGCKEAIRTFIPPLRNELPEAHTPEERANILGMRKYGVSYPVPLEDLDIIPTTNRIHDEQLQRAAEEMADSIESQKLDPPS